MIACVCCYLSFKYKTVLSVFQNDVVCGVMCAFVCASFNVVVCSVCNLLCDVVWIVCLCVFVVFVVIYMFM